MAVAGRLHVFINADAKQFMSGLKDVERAGKKLEGVGRNMSTALTAPLAAAAAAIGLVTTRTAQYAANIDDAAHRTGLSSTAIQELQYVSTQLGTSFENVEGVIGAFTRRLPEIERGSGSAAQALARIGVSARDSAGNIRPMTDLFRDVLVGLGDVRNETQRNALATQLLGRSALQIAPMLAAGGDEIERLADRAHELGLVMGDDRIAELAAFDDQMEEVRSQAGAAGRALGLAFLPVVKDVLDLIQTTAVPLIKDLADTIRGISPNTMRWAAAIGAVAAVAGPAIVVIGSLTRAIAGIGIALGVSGGPIGLAAIALGGLAAMFLKSKLDAASAAAETDEFAESLRGVAGAEHMITVARAMQRQEALRAQRAHATSAGQIEAIDRELVGLEIHINAATEAFNALQTAGADLPDLDLDTKPEDLIDLTDTVALLRAELSVREKIAALETKERPAADPKGLAVEAMSKGLEETQAQYEGMMATAEQWSGLVVDQFAGLVTGALTVKDAFRNMVTAVVSWLGQLLAKLIAVQIVTAIIGGATGGVGAGFKGFSFGVPMKIPTGSSLSIPTGAAPSLSTAGAGGGSFSMDFSSYPKPMSPDEAARTQHSLSMFAAQLRQHVANGGTFG